MTRIATFNTRHITNETVFNLTQNTASVIVVPIYITLVPSVITDDTISFVIICDTEPGTVRPKLRVSDQIDLKDSQ